MQSEQTTVQGVLDEERRFDLRGAWARHRGNLIRSAIGFGLLAWAVRALARRYLLAVSMNAMVVVNSFDVVAPIDGAVHRAVQELGHVVDKGAVLAVLENPLVDVTELADSKHRAATLDGHIESLAKMVAEYEQMGSAFLRRGNEFQQTRIKQLEIEISAAETRLEGNQARAQEARARFKRAETLGAEKLASAEELQQSQRDYTVAQVDLAAATRELENSRQVLSSQKRGLSLSDYSTNDKSYSGQRHDELEITLTRLREELAQARSERAALATQIGIQQEQVNQLSKFSVAAQQRSQLVSWSAGDGVYVIRGTPLMRLTDCTHVRVIAYVSERVYNRLRVGDKAEIQVGADRRLYPGKVEVLLGPPEQRIPLSSSLNLPPELRDRYAVSILSSALGQREQCDSGQSAEVKLQPSLGYW